MQHVRTQAASCYRWDQFTGIEDDVVRRTRTAPRGWQVPTRICQSELHIYAMRVSPAERSGVDPAAAGCDPAVYLRSCVLGLFPRRRPENPKRTAQINLPGYVACMHVRLHVELIRVSDLAGNLACHVEVFRMGCPRGGAGQM